MKLSHKLSIGTGFITLLLAIIAIIGVFDLNRSSAAFEDGLEITEAASQAAAIETDLLQVRRGEKDLLARQDLKYFEHTMNYLDSARERAEFTIQYVNNPEYKEDLREIISQLEIYESEFQKLKETLVERGLSHNDGVQKLFRDAAHQVQNSSTGTTQVLILTLRKHEKDYMLRSDEKYVTKAEEVIADLRGRVSNVILDDYWSNFTQLVDLDKRIQDHLSGMKSAADLAMEHSVAVNQHLKSTALKESASVVSMTHTAIASLIILSILAVIAALGGGVYLGRIITRPVKEVADIAKSIAADDLDHTVNINQNDEIGELADSINQMIATLRANREKMVDISMGQDVVDEVKRVARAMRVDGDLDMRPNLEIARGSFREMLEEFSVFIDDFVGDMLDLMEGATRYAEGNFEYQIKEMPGKKVAITQAFSKLRSNLLALIDEGTVLADAAEAGQLQIRGNPEKFEGGFRKIIAGFNTTIENMVAPVQETATVLKKMAAGDLSNYVTGDYNGDHATIKNAVNDMIRSLNEILFQVTTAITEVAQGAQQVSDSSQSLSEGSNSQAGALEEITSSMMQIGSQTKASTEHANQANSLSETARDLADRGNQQMEQMLAAIEDINQSSSEIGRIIKVIDEIAFQTNLLALNAAVEAARAGVHGKGFAVVAEEVRNLAQRSANSAKETTALIEGSASKVGVGSNIANETAKAFGEIVKGIVDVNTLVKEISESATEQQSGIDQINSALTQVEGVTQINSSNAEESAAASEELFNQSQLLQEMISRFTLDSKTSSRGINTAKPQKAPKNDQKSLKDPVEVSTEQFITLDDDIHGF